MAGAGADRWRWLRRCWSLSWRSDDHDGAEVLFGLTFVAYGVVGALIATRHPRNPVGWLFCAAGLLSAASEALHSYAVEPRWSAGIGPLPPGSRRGPGDRAPSPSSCILLLFPTGHFQSGVARRRPGGDRARRRLGTGGGAGPRTAPEYADGDEPGGDRGRRRRPGPVRRCRRNCVLGAAARGRHLGGRPLPGGSAVERAADQVARHGGLSRGRGDPGHVPPRAGDRHGPRPRATS